MTLHHSLFHLLQITDTRWKQATFLNHWITENSRGRAKMNSTKLWYGKDINNDCVKPLEYQGLSTVAVSVAYVKTNINIIDFFFYKLTLKIFLFIPRFKPSNTNSRFNSHIIQESSNCIALFTPYPCFYVLIAL